MFFTCSIRGDLWSMCKETGYNISFDSCRKLQKACCLSDIPCKMMMTTAGSLSPRISRKVIPVDIPSGDCESWSLICTLCHTLGMGVLGQGGLRAAVAFLFFHFSSAAPLRAIHLQGHSASPWHHCPDFPLLWVSSQSFSGIPSYCKIFWQKQPLP